MPATRLIMLALLLAPCSRLFADERPSDQKLKGGKGGASVWMEQKLQYTTNILEGMAEGDFDMIAEQAAAMRFLNRIEGFVRQRPKGYRDELRSFQSAVDSIERMALSENLDGVTVGFHQLTISCVRCHKKMRQSPTPAPSSERTPKSERSEQ